MGFASARSYGGIGFAIEKPCVEIEVRRSSQTKLFGFDAIDSAANQQVKRIAAKLHGEGRGFRATLKTMPPQHVGFGTKTALLLGLIAGVSQLFGKSMNKRNMQLMSGRGGASGIGINTFFEGGVIWDAGHVLPKGSSLQPSSASLTGRIAPRIARLRFPAEWQVALMLAQETPIAGQFEEEFFQTNTPTPRVEALESIATLCHGVLPAIYERDLAALARSLVRLHQIGFKKRELAARTRRTRSLLAALQERSHAAGMSSLGPLIYLITERGRGQLKDAKQVCAQLGATFIGVTSGRNNGYELQNMP